MVRHYYAFAHRYGIEARDKDGDRIGTLMIFPTRTARDAWVVAGPEYRSEIGYRETVKACYAHRFIGTSLAVVYA